MIDMGGELDGFLSNGEAMGISPISRVGCGRLVRGIAVALRFSASRCLERVSGILAKFHERKRAGCR